MKEKIGTYNRKEQQNSNISNITNTDEVKQQRQTWHIEEHRNGKSNITNNNKREREILDNKQQYTRNKDTIMNIKVKKQAAI